MPHTKSPSHFKTNGIRSNTRPDRPHRRPSLGALSAAIVIVLGGSQALAGNCFEDALSKMEKIFNEGKTPSPKTTEQKIADLKAHGVDKPVEVPSDRSLKPISNKPLKEGDTVSVRGSDGTMRAVSVARQNEDGSVVVQWVSNDPATGQQRLRQVTVPKDKVFDAAQPQNVAVKAEAAAQTQQAATQARTVAAQSREPEGFPSQDELMQDFRQMQRENSSQAQARLHNQMEQSQQARSQTDYKPADVAARERASAEARAFNEQNAARVQAREAAAKQAEIDRLEAQRAADAAEKQRLAELRQQAELSRQQRDAEAKAAEAARLRDEVARRTSPEAQAERDRFRQYEADARAREAAQDRRAAYDRQTANYNRGSRSYQAPSPEAPAPATMRLQADGSSRVYRSWADNLIPASER